MSSEQQTLDASIPAPGQDTVDASAWQPGEGDARKNRCRNCGDQIDHDFGRVFGDNDDQADRCLGCACMRELVDGAGAGKDVEPARSNSPARSGGQRGESL